MLFFSLVKLAAKPKCPLVLRSVASMPNHVLPLSKIVLDMLLFAYAFINLHYRQRI